MKLWPARLRPHRAGPSDADEARDRLAARLLQLRNVNQELRLEYGEGTLARPFKGEDPDVKRRA